MGIGAVGALNTMYSAVAERPREIATMRALGFGAGSVVLSFLIEALLISFRARAGVPFGHPFERVDDRAMNFQTFSYLAFAFSSDADLLLGGYRRSPFSWGSSARATGHSSRAAACFSGFWVLSDLSFLKNDSPFLARAWRRS